MEKNLAKTGVGCVSNCGAAALNELKLPDVVDSNKPLENASIPHCTPFPKILTKMRLISN